MRHETPLGLYLKNTKPLSLRLDIPYNITNLNAAIQEIWKQHRATRLDLPFSPHENYLRTDMHTYLPLSEVIRTGLIPSVSNKQKRMTSQELLGVYRESLRHLDCIYFSSDTDKETVYVHQARLARLFAERKRNEITQVMKKLTQVSKKVE